MSPTDWILTAVAVVTSAIAAAHAMMWKRSPRAAMGWVAISLFVPFFGALFYFLFGINRIQTRARTLERMPVARREPEGSAPRVAAASEVAPRDLPAEFSELARVSGAVTGLPLTGGNSIQVLHNGDQAFPAMLEAIDAARRTLFLITYIFESNRSGRQFIDALARAVERGVEVLVIVDGFGEWYSWPRISRLLARRGVRVARFLAPKLLPPSIHFNLRNHRKVLVADGWVGFTGGMNIGDRHLIADRDDPKRVVDIHFRLEGPVVAQLESVFLDDWAFASGEASEPSVIDHSASGEAICRTVVDGPDADIDKLLTILVGAVSAARRRVAVMTPYFLPPRVLIGVLRAAALRGVEVAVILPAVNNLPFMHWASRNLLWELLERGVRVYYQPPPFAHSKLFVVDDHYVQVGSANLDERSLRLNFELAVEVFDEPFARLVMEHFEAVRERSREVTLDEVDGRGLPARFRDSLAWLFTPYL